MESNHGRRKHQKIITFVINPEAQVIFEEAQQIIESMKFPKAGALGLHQMLSAPANRVCCVRH